MRLELDGHLPGVPDQRALEFGGGTGGIGSGAGGSAAVPDSSSSIFSSSGAAAGASAPTDASYTALSIRASARFNFSEPRFLKISSNLILHAGEWV